MVDLCSRAPPFAPVSTRSLGGSPLADVDCDPLQQHWKMVDRVLGSWFVTGKYGFILRRLSVQG